VTIFEYAIARTYGQLTRESEHHPLSWHDAQVLENIRPCVEQYEAREIAQEGAKA
jgi:hypothetical protein